MWIIREETPDLGCVTVALPMLILLAGVVCHFWQVHERHVQGEALRTASEQVLQEAADPRTYDGIFERPHR